MRIQYFMKLTPFVMKNVNISQVKEDEIYANYVIGENGVWNLTI